MDIKEFGQNNLQLALFSDYGANLCDLSLRIMETMSEYDKTMTDDDAKIVLDIVRHWVTGRGRLHRRFQDRDSKKS